VESEISDTRSSASGLEPSVDLSEWFAITIAENEIAATP
jgi:hypothetical protein